MQINNYRNISAPIVSTRENFKYNIQPRCPLVMSHSHVSICTYSITNSSYTNLFPGMLFCEHPKIQFRAYAKYYLTLSQDMLLDGGAR